MKRKEFYAQAMISALPVCLTQNRDIEDAAQDASFAAYKLLKAFDCDTKNLTDEEI